MLGSRPSQFPTGQQRKLPDDLGALLPDPGKYCRFVGCLIYITIT